jgi:transcriptional regulator with XRE-family HTH domain
MDLRHRIVSFRAKHGLSQAAFAERAGVGPATIIRIESMKAKTLQPATLYKLAKALEIDPGELIPGYKE